MRLCYNDGIALINQWVKKESSKIWGEPGYSWFQRNPIYPDKEGRLMTQAYLIHQGLDEFTAAREQFAQLIEALQSEPNLEREHGDIEELIWHDGKEF